MKDLHTLFTQPSEPVPSWIEGGILPKGSFFLFGGESGIGKSFLALNLIRNLVADDTWFGTKFKVLERPKCILYLDIEVGENMVAERVKKVFEGAAFAPGQVYVKTFPDITLDQPAEREIFWNLLESVPTLPDIVIIDPMSYLLSRDDSDNQVVKETYRTLVRTQEKYNKDMTFVMSHHFRKAPTGKHRELYDPLDASEFRGASWWINQAWTAITLERVRPNNPDQGWDLNARIAKLRAAGILKTDRYFTLDGETMRVEPRVDPNSTWGIVAE